MNVKSQAGMIYLYLLKFTSCYTNLYHIASVKDNKVGCVDVNILAMRYSMAFSKDPPSVYFNMDDAEKCVCEFLATKEQDNKGKLFFLFAPSEDSSAKRE